MRLYFSQNLACTLSSYRFKTLNDINSNHYLLFNSGTRWLSFWLDFMAATMTLMVSLFVVLSDDKIISPSLKGLAMSYTIQVNLDSRWMSHNTLHRLQHVCLQAVLMSYPVDRPASVHSEAVDRGGGKVQLSGAPAGIHHGQALNFSASEKYWHRSQIQYCPLNYSRREPAKSHIKKDVHHVLAIITHPFYPLTPSADVYCVQGCKSEAPRHIKEAEIPEHWPKAGVITFQNYKMRYRENTPIVLNGLNFSIRAGEKLGIVGRTGSGKCK